MEVSAAAAAIKQWSPNRNLQIFAIGVIGLHVVQEIFIGQGAVGSFVSNFLQISCALFAVLACARASRKARGFTRPFWLLVGLSLAIWIAADTGWIYYETFLRISPSRESIFHFFVDCRALLLAMALLLDPEEEDSGYSANAGWLLDVCQLFIIFTLIYLAWYQAASQHQSRALSLVRSDLIELGENVAVFALAFVQMARARTEAARRLYQALLLCFAPLFVGILITDYNELRYGVELPTGTWLDLFWTITFLMTTIWATRWESEKQSHNLAPRDRRFWSMLLENAFYACGPLIVLMQVTALTPEWRHLAFALLGASILCFAARLALSEFRETESARRLQQAYGALFQSELRFRTLIEDAPLAVATRRHGKLLWANPKFSELFGYEQEEVPGLPIGSIVAPDFRDEMETRVQLRSKGENVSRHYESIGMRKDGSQFDAEFDVAQVLLPDGPASLAFISDISHRKQAENALRESEDRYRDLIEHSEDLVCTHDLQGKLLSVNPAPARLLGYEIDELLKMSMRDLIAPEFREQFDAYLEQIASRGSARGLLTVVAKNGKRRIWEYSNSLRIEGVPSPLVRGIAHDITERKRAEAALRQSEARMRLLIEHSPAAVAIFDREMRYVQASRRWMTDYRIGNRDLSGVSHYELFPEIPERWKEVHRRGLAGEVIVEDGDRFDRADGTVQWIRWEVHPWREGNGEIGGIAIFAEEISARKRTEEALRHSEERFRVALKDSPITVFNQDQNLRYTWVYNPQMYWEQEIIGKTDEDLLGPKKAAILTQLKEKVLKTAVAVREECAIQQNGNRYVFDLSIEPLFNPDGEVIGITGASIDIARLRDMADRLQESTDQLSREKSYLQTEIQTELGFEEIIGRSSSLREVLRKTQVVAPTDSTVLLLGETGTGKELAARSVHGLSTRRDHTFVKLNCAAVPSGLLESELFGHEKGAFTSAVSQKVGRIELAHKGTLFLDEIGEMPLELQPKLLRVLQDREFERLGGVKTLCVDVRIIAATNRDLRQDVADKKFREDLFYRLNVFPIQLPALRNRKEDIPLLVHHFVHKHASKMNKHISQVPNDVMSTLCKWNWPGNIRELENMIERMVIMSKGSVLTAPPAEIQKELEHGEEDLAEMEREHILRILRMTNGVLSGPDGAANRLGVKRTTLQSMMKRLGIEPSEYRGWGNGTSGRS